MPRLPHRLVKPPTQMSMPELAVFGILGASVTVGLLQMGSDATRVLREAKQPVSESNKNPSVSAVSPMNWGKKDS